MSQLELRLFTALAISQRRVLKNCDIKQAFVKSSLPEDEHYFVRPPKGCSRSQPGTYWKLIRSLYGLRRAPKLRYEKLSSHLCSMGLKQSATSPCIFIGHPVAGSPPIYVGIYVDNIIYFSSVEKWFETNLSTIGDVDFMGKVSHFLGIEFTWNELPDGHLCVSLTQQSFVESLLDSLNISVDVISTYTSPYHSGVNIDSIPCQDMNSIDRDRLRLQYQSLVGSLNWLAHTTRPDISTVVSLLAQHQSQPSQGHYDAALYGAYYLATTRNLGIYFTSTWSSTLESFFIFHYLNHCYLCQMLIGVLKMLLPRNYWISHFLPHDQCRLSILIYLDHYTGSLNDKLLLLVVPLKRRSMPQMNVLSFS
jgi:hypothetical protein